MIQADQRSSLRHAVALNNGIAHTLEEVLGFIRKRCTTGDKCPKPPAKATVDSAEHPDAPEKFSALCVFKSAIQPLRFSRPFEFPLDSRMKKIKYARNTDERSGAFLLDGANDSGGIVGWFENDRRSQKWRNEERHELAEHMAQRNKVDKAQRVKPALVFAIRIDAALQRLKVRQKIAVGEHHPARLGRCARSVKNFGNGASYGGVTRSYAGLRLRDRAGYNILQIVYDHRRCRTGQFHLLTVTQDELHPGIFNRALNELWGCRGVHRHDHGTAQEDAP